jgi:hypothetical protein
MKKFIVPSLILLAVAVLATIGLWFAVSVIARLNPELNLGGRSMVPELQPEDEICTDDAICMQDQETGDTRVVSSSCDGDTVDVGTLEAQGWTRCAPISNQEPESSNQ